MPSKKKTNNQVPPSNAKLGWHFLPSDMCLKYGDGRKAKVGETLSTDLSEQIAVCHGGMHASAKVAHSASFKAGPVLTRVKVWGEISDDGNKFAGRHRHVLWAKALTIADIKKCLTEAGYGYSGSGNTTLSDWVCSLGYAADQASYSTKIGNWLEKWAVDNGLNGGTTQTVKFVYEKRELTEKDLKQFLSTRMVRTDAEIRKDMEQTWECDGGPSGVDDTLEDFLMNSSDNYGRTDIHIVEGYGPNGENGYVLKLKKRRS
jgi:hypothetical protein